MGELGTAQGALQLAEELKPDVVLTDICMPGLDGLSFAGLLKGICPNVRVIAVTGHDDFEYAQRGIRVGLDNYLLKPIDEKELETVALEVKESIFSQHRHRISCFRELSDYRKADEPIVREILFGENYWNLICTRTLCLKRLWLLCCPAKRASIRLQ